MNVKTPQFLTILGVILVVVVGLLLAGGGADALFPVPTSTPIATATFTVAPIPTAKPLPGSLILVYTNDALGYLDPCAA